VTIEAPQIQELPAGVLPPSGRIVAVASGKGGVGKSTVSVNVSLALAETGASVGLLDADIYGPNIPQMMGIRQPLERSPSGKIQPLTRYGIRVVSVGFVVGETDAVIYRGPLVGKMIKRFLGDVEWGDLDYLIVDLPPGTGDASLTLAQSVALTGTVIVTTPQQVALADVRKSITMFQRLRVPLLGIVENMSYYLDPGSGTPVYIFGRGGGKALSEELVLPFLGDIPLDPEVCAAGDAGKPVIIAHPDSGLAGAFRRIAVAVAEQADRAAQAGPPTLEIDPGDEASPL
jgi:ATP-binding protein involved in chromosome partitioning